MAKFNDINDSIMGSLMEGFAAAADRLSESSQQRAAQKVELERENFLRILCAEHTELKRRDAIAVRRFNALLDQAKALEKDCIALTKALDESNARVFALQTQNDKLELESRTLKENIGKSTLRGNAWEEVALDLHVKLGGEILEVQNIPMGDAKISQLYYDKKKLLLEKAKSFQAR